MNTPLKQSPITYNVEDYIPHRPPMLLVDEVIDMKAGESIHTRKTFNEGDQVFAGHFPKFPILPGMLAVEALAQSSAIYVSINEGRVAENTLFYFMAAENIKFRKPVFPGDKVDMYVTVVQSRGHVFKFYGKMVKSNNVEDVLMDATFTAKWDTRD